MPPRQAVPIAIQRLVLHEAGYRCANPVCRTVLTLEIHHLEHVATGGSNEAENLLPLCPNCHSLHHQGNIPIESLRSWKALLLSLNQAFDTRTVDILLALDVLDDGLFISGDAVLNCAPLITSEMIRVEPLYHELGSEAIGAVYHIELTSKGRSFVKAWKRGDQISAIAGDA